MEIRQNTHNLEGICEIYDSIKHTTVWKYDSNIRIIWEKKWLVKKFTLSELGRCLPYDRKNTCMKDAEVLCVIAAITQTTTKTGNNWFLN